jgi:hypothetical protein
MGGTGRIIAKCMPDGGTRCCGIPSGHWLAIFYRCRYSKVIKTKKCFSLEKLDENIFIDHLQEKTGYIALSKLIDNKKFSQVIADVRNNSKCPMFDAAIGAIILDSEITDIIRIYSGNLDLEMLKCIQNMFERSI